MNDQQKQNRQQIIAAEEIGNASLLREVIYLRGRVERLEAQLAIRTTSRDYWRSAALAKHMAEDAEGERKPGDSNDCLVPRPSNFGTILEWFDARIAYHDRDESGDE